MQHPIHNLSPKNYVLHVRSRSPFFHRDTSGFLFFLEPGWLYTEKTNHEDLLFPKFLKEGGPSLSQAISWESDSPISVSVENIIVPQKMPTHKCQQSRPTKCWPSQGAKAQSPQKTCGGAGEHATVGVWDYTGLCGII